MDYSKVVETCQNWIDKGCDKPMPYSLHQPSGFLESRIQQIIKSRRFDKSKDAQIAADALFDMLITRRLYRMDAIIELLPLFQRYQEINIAKELWRKNPSNTILRQKLNMLYKIAFGKHAAIAHVQMLGLDGHFCREHPVPSLKRVG